MRYLPVLVLTMWLGGCGGDKPKVVINYGWKQSLILMEPGDSLYIESPPKYMCNVCSTLILQDSLRSAAPPKHFCTDSCTVGGMRPMPIATDSQRFILVDSVDWVDKRMMAMDSATYYAWADPPCDSIYFARLDSLNALLRPLCTVYVTDTVYQPLSYPVPIWTVDQHGKPIKNVRIGIYDKRGKSSMWILTDVNGYALPRLQVGQWRMDAYKASIIFNDTTIITTERVTPVVFIGREFDVSPPTK